VPQALASQSGLADALPLKYIRVMRIAVHPAVQRQGFGASMLAEMTERFQQMGMDMLATSFGATPGLLAFWRQAGLAVVRLGVHKDAASGEHAVMMLKPLTDAGNKLLRQAQHQFYRPFVQSLPALFPQISPELVGALLAGAPESLCATFKLSEDEMQSVQHYGYFFRPYETVFYPLWKCLIGAMMSNQSRDKHRDLLIEKVMLHKSWHDVAHKYGLAGRKQVEQEMKEGLKSLIPLLNSK
jgi:tRNA(Met) cytidine acetyltransferase